MKLIDGMVFVLCYNRAKLERGVREILLVKKANRWLPPFRSWKEPVGDLEEWLAEALIGLKGFELMGLREYLIRGKTIYVVEAVGDKFQCLPGSKVKVAVWTGNPSLFLGGFPVQVVDLCLGLGIEPTQVRVYSR